MTFEPVNDQRCRLGEGPHWWAERQQLLWVDMLQGDVHAWSPDGRSTVRRVSDRATFVIPTADEGLLLGLRHGLGGIRALADSIASEGLQPAVVVEPDMAQSSTNDARCDPRGRLWFGTVDRVDRQPVCALYRWTPAEGLRQALGQVAISNGIQWSPDGRTLYYIDSALHRLDAFDYDLDRGELGARRTLCAIDPALGLPDGINVDSQGLVYVAMYGGGAIRCYTPDGRLERIIGLPVRYPSSCTFGGADLRTLFVTSGNAHVVPEPGGSGLDGAVLACEVSVPGQPTRALAARLTDVLGPVSPLSREPSP